MNRACTRIDGRGASLSPCFARAVVSAMKRPRVEGGAGRTAGVAPRFRAIPIGIIPNRALQPSQTAGARWYAGLLSYNEVGIGKLAMPNDQDRFASRYARRFWCRPRLFPPPRRRIAPEPAARAARSRNGCGSSRTASCLVRPHPCAAASTLKLHAGTRATHRIPVQLPGDFHDPKPCARGYAFRIARRTRVRPAPRPRRLGGAHRRADRTRTRRLVRRLAGGIRPAVRTDGRAGHHDPARSAQASELVPRAVRSVRRRARRGSHLHLQRSARGRGSDQSLDRAGRDARHAPTGCSAARCAAARSTWCRSRWARSARRSRISAWSCPTAPTWRSTCGS